MNDTPLNPDLVSIRLARLLQERGLKVGEFNARCERLRFRLAELKSLREAHADGRQLRRDGAESLHISDVVREQAEARKELDDLTASHRAELAEIDAAVKACERLDDLHRSGLDIERVQLAEQALMFTGDPQGLGGKVIELINAVIDDLALHVNAPSERQLTAHWLVVSSAGYGSSRACKVWEIGQVHYGNDPAQHARFGIGLRAEYRPGTDDGGMEREPKGVPVDACIYYLANLQRQRLSPPDLPSASTPSRLDYDDPFQDD